MEIGQRLRQLREEKNLSQGHIESKTGLLRCYVSRVENGHTVPSIATLEKLARALEVPMYKLFHNGEKPPQKPVPMVSSDASDDFGNKGKEAVFFRQLHKLLSKMSDDDRKMILYMAAKMAK